MKLERGMSYLRRVAMRKYKSVYRVRINKMKVVAKAKPLLLLKRELAPNKKKRTGENTKELLLATAMQHLTNLNSKKQRKQIANKKKTKLIKRHKGKKWRGENYKK